MLSLGGGGRAITMGHHQKDILKLWSLPCIHQLRMFLWTMCFSGIAFLFLHMLSQGIGMCYAMVIGFVAWSDPPTPSPIRKFCLEGPPLVLDLENFLSWGTSPGIKGGARPGCCLLVPDCWRVNIYLWWVCVCLEGPPFGYGPRKFLVLRVLRDPLPSFGLRTFLVLDLENFQPPPLAGKFAGRCRSEVKKKIQFC